RQILDDNNDGDADADPIARLQADSQSYVDGFLRPIYPLPLVIVPGEVKRICLDVAHGYAAIRHPEYVRFDGYKLLDRARVELTDLRMGKTRLDIQGAPEPAKNEGGQARSGDPRSPAPKPKFFADGTGDF